MSVYSIQLKKVSKVYKSSTIEVDAVNDVSFSIKRGEFASILGPSGSGKSTLMHLIGTIDKPTKGEVYIDDIPTSTMKENELSRFRNEKLGFVFQSFNLVNGITAEMNVELPLMVNSMSMKDRRRRADKMLIEQGLEERIKLRPNQLSGGQQQRVAIARALVNNPSIILADEPTGNLDSKAGDRVMRLFKEICKKQKDVTVLVVTHDQNIIKHCDHVIYIRDGRIEKETFKRIKVRQ